MSAPRPAGSPERSSEPALEGDRRTGPDGRPVAQRGWVSERRPLAERYDAFLLDLDGVVYRGTAPIPSAARAVEALRRDGRRVVFLTNNSARTPARVAETLSSLGIPAVPHDVVTSARAVVSLLADLRGGSVYVVGEEGVRTALGEAGLEVVESEAERVDAVVVGWDRAADYAKLRIASVLVERGARLVATNADAGYPAPGGELWPGAGALLAAIETTTGVQAEIAGKPHRPLFDAALDRAGADSALVVGDRVETDVAGAAGAGLDAALVLSGAAAPADVLDHDALPVAILDDLEGVLVERPDTVVRAATPDDDAAIEELVRGAGLAEPPGGDGRVVVTGADGPVATAAVRTQGRDAYLHSVAVRELERGLSLGTLAVAAAFRSARGGGAVRCYLVTETAEPFFARLGFGRVDRGSLPDWIRPLATECLVSASAMVRGVVQYGSAASVRRRR